MNKTCAEISQLKGCTRQAVKDFLNRNNVKPSAQKGKRLLYDCSTEPLKSYLETVQNKPCDAQEGPVNDTDQKSRKKTSNIISKPLNELLEGKTAGQKPATYFYYEALKLAKQNKDASLYMKLANIAGKEDADESMRLQMIELEKSKERIFRERAERLKIENDIRRSLYLEKTLVKTIFGRVYAVHTSTLTPLSLKISSTIAAIPPGDKQEITIRKIIDDEVYSALESIKRQLIDFIESESESDTEPSG